MTELGFLRVRFVSLLFQSSLAPPAHPTGPRTGWAYPLALHPIRHLSSLGETGRAQPSIPAFAVENTQGRRPRPGGGTPVGVGGTGGLQLNYLNYLLPQIEEQNGDLDAVASYIPVPFIVPPDVFNWKNLVRQEQAYSPQHTALSSLQAGAVCPVGETHRKDLALGAWLSFPFWGEEPYPGSQLVPHCWHLELFGCCLAPLHTVWPASPGGLPRGRVWQTVKGRTCRSRAGVVGVE